MLTIILQSIFFLRPFVLCGYIKVDEFGNTNRPIQPLNDRDVYLVRA